MAQANRSVSWDGVRLSLPEGMIDQTVLTFVDKGDAPAVGITVSQEKLDGGKAGLLRYVTDQLRDIQRAVPGYAVQAQAERGVGHAEALPAIHVHAVVAASGRRRVQHQLYALDEKNGRVIIATVTALETHAARASALLDELAGSLRIEGASA